MTTRRPTPSQSSKHVVFNVRLPEWLDTLIRDAADYAGVDRSSWARHVMEEAARETVTVPSYEFDPRIPDDLLRLMREASKAAAMPLSAWAVEALEAGARRDLAASQPVPLGMSTPEQARNCIHPLTARRTLSTRVECGVCGAVVRRFL